MSVRCFVDTFADGYAKLLRTFTVSAFVFCTCCMCPCQHSSICFVDARESETLVSDYVWMAPTKCCKFLCSDSNCLSYTIVTHHGCPIGCNRCVTDAMGYWSFLTCFSVASFIVTFLHEMCCCVHQCNALLFHFSHLIWNRTWECLGSWLEI